MNLTPLQSSFASGEITPLMRNRSELEGYKSSVEEMENIIPIAQGECHNRPPFELLGTLAGESIGRVETLQITANLFFVMIFTDLKLSFWTDRGDPVNVGFVTNPRFNLFENGWTITTDGGGVSTVTFNHYACVLSPQNKAAKWAGIQQQVTVITGTNEHTLVINSDVAANEDFLSIKIGTTQGGTEILDTTIFDDSVEVLFTPGINTFWIEVTNTNEDTTSNDVTLSLVEVVSSVVENSVVTPYLGVDVNDLHFTAAPSGGLVFMTHQKYPVQQVTYDHVTGLFTFAASVFTSTPTEWGAENYPATGVVHKGRLYLAATPNEPEQIWASVIDDYFDFTYGAATATDAFSVVNERFGTIKWMLSTKTLVMGTANAEYLITSDGPVIYIGDISIDGQSSYGSAAIQAIQVGDQVLYITNDNKKVHAMQYSESSDNWLSEELSFPSEHIPKVGIRSFSWQRYPHSLFWMVLKDGTLACMSYNRPMKIAGWSRHNTQGIFVSSAVGNKGGKTILLSLIDRDTDDLNLECETENGNPMDSRLIIHLSPPGTVVTGLDHLEGFEVQVVTDGAVHPNRTVTGGQITLQLDATVVQVGLGFNKHMKTLPFDKGSNKGSGRAYKKKYKDIHIELLDSAIPLINGQLAPIRHPSTPMGEVEPYTSGLVHINNLGFDFEAPIEIDQPGPLSFATTGFFGEVVQDKT